MIFTTPSMRIVLPLRTKQSSTPVKTRTRTRDRPPRKSTETCMVESMMVCSWTCTVQLAQSSPSTGLELESVRIETKVKSGSSKREQINEYNGPLTTPRIKIEENSKRYVSAHFVIWITLFNILISVVDTPIRSGTILWSKISEEETYGVPALDQSLIDVAVEAARNRLATEKQNNNTI